MKAVEEIKVELSVVLGHSVMPIRQLLKMGRGAVIDLDANAESLVLVYANNQLIAKGEIVLVGDHIGVTIIERVKPERGSDR